MWWRSRTKAATQGVFIRNRGRKSSLPDQHLQSSDEALPECHGQRQRMDGTKSKRTTASGLCCLPWQNGPRNVLSNESGSIRHSSQIGGTQKNAGRLAAGNTAQSFGRERRSGLIRASERSIDRSACLLAGALVGIIFEASICAPFLETLLLLRCYLFSSRKKNVESSIVPSLSQGLPSYRLPTERHFETVSLPRSSS